MRYVYTPYIFGDLQNHFILWALGAVVGALLFFLFFMILGLNWVSNLLIAFVIGLPMIGGVYYLNNKGHKYITYRPKMSQLPEIIVYTSN